MGVSGSDTGPLERNGGKCIVAPEKPSDNDAGPARLIGEFRCPMTPE
ncbi:MAG: hypothetical protein JWR37_1263 [Mycobacterium sp.]|jgi:hypothetical protein|nr:hypothetical protein [Mycobacterium sp.]